MIYDGVQIFCDAILNVTIILSVLKSGPFSDLLYITFKAGWHIPEFLLVFFIFGDYNELGPFYLWTNIGQIFSVLRP